MQNKNFRKILYSLGVFVLSFFLIFTLNLNISYATENPNLGVEKNTSENIFSWLDNYKNHISDSFQNVISKNDLTANILSSIGGSLHGLYYDNVIDPLSSVFCEWWFCGEPVIVPVNNITVKGIKTKTPLTYTPAQVSVVLPRVSNPVVSQPVIVSEPPAKYINNYYPTTVIRETAPTTIIKETKNDVDISKLISDILFRNQINRVYDSVPESTENLARELERKIRTVTLAVSGDAEIGGDLTIVGTITGNVAGTINPSFTLGSVPFQGASGLAQDNANLFWNDTTNALGVGTNLPSASAILDITSSGKGLLMPRMTAAQRDLIGTPSTGLIIYNTDSNQYNFYNGSAWTPIVSGVISSALSSVTAATTDITIANAANNVVWNWQLSGAETGMKFGESAASTGGSNNQYVLQASTLAGSTAMPLFVENLGNSRSFQVDDEAGDTTPFVIDSAGGVGIGTTSPDGRLEIAGNMSQSAWGLNGIALQGTAATFTDTSSSGTVTNNVVNSFAQPTLAASSATTYTNSATLYIANAPAAGTNATITNPYALWVDGGNVRFDGNISFGVTDAYPKFTNTNTNITDGLGVGLGAGSMAWDTNEIGYVMGLRNLASGSFANGLIVRTTDITNGSRILDLNSNGTDRVVVHGDGSAYYFNLVSIGAYITDSMLSVTPAGNAILGTPGLGGSATRVIGNTFTDNNTAGSGTATNMVFNSIGQPTLAATNTTVTTTNAYTSYISGAPISGTNQTLTNTSALYIAATATVDGAGGYSY